MYLEIENPEEMDIAPFAEWLCERLRESAADPATHDPSLETLWSNYFEDNDLGWPRDDSDDPIAPSAGFIIDMYFNNLILQRRGQNIIITVDPTATLRGTSITIDSLAALMNYGTLLTTSYPYFDSIFEAYADNLQEYYDQWAELEFLKSAGGEVL